MCVCANCNFSLKFWWFDGKVCLTYQTVNLLVFFVVKMPCHQWRCWWPYDARAVCLLKPWWAVLSSHYPSMMYSNYPDTSVSDAPLHSFLISFQLPPNFPDCVFSWWKTSCHWRILFIIVRCLPASLNTSSLLFFSVHEILIILNQNQTSATDNLSFIAFDICLCFRTV